MCVCPEIVSNMCKGVLDESEGVCVCVSVLVCFGPERIPQQKERSW